MSDDLTDADLEELERQDLEGERLYEVEAEVERLREDMARRDAVICLMSSELHGGGWLRISPAWFGRWTPEQIEATADEACEIHVQRFGLA